MTEAAGAVLGLGFKTLSASRIEASHATWNIASRRVLQKIGMSFVRHVPQGFEKGWAMGRGGPLRNQRSRLEKTGRTDRSAEPRASWRPVSGVKPTGCMTGFLLERPPAA